VAFRAAGGPGYDAAPSGPSARATDFEKTAVMNNPGAPAMPQAGDDKTGQEP
jgi:hypothetical protein